MEFRDLKKQYQVLEKDINKAFFTVTKDANYIMGNQVQNLEEKLAEYVGAKYCISCANGTDALQLSLMAWNVGEGDAVFVPDFTFFSSGEVVALQHATPVFVDVDKNTFNMDAEKLEEKIKQVVKEGRWKPKAIIAVDLFGCPANYDKIVALAKKYKLLLLEDGAQGFGGSIRGKRACSFGDIGTTSFFPAKPLGCYGDGGAIFTDDSEMAELLKSYRIHGKGTGKYDNIRIGINSRLDTIQAAILDVKLNAFKEYELSAVNEVARKYTYYLHDIVNTPKIVEGFESSWAQYTIVLPNNTMRDGLKGYLKEKNIPSMIYYPKPMHRQKAFQIEQCNEEDYKITNQLCETVLALPMHPYMEEDMVQYISEHIIKYCTNSK